MEKVFSYLPEIITNPHLTDADSDVYVTNPNFIGEICKECVKKYDRCWYDKSDWDKDLIEANLMNQKI